MKCLFLTFYFTNKMKFYHVNYNIYYYLFNGLHTTFNSQINDIQNSPFNISIFSIVKIIELKNDLFNLQVSLTNNSFYLLLSLALLLFTTMQVTKLSYNNRINITYYLIIFLVYLFFFSYQWHNQNSDGLWFYVINLLDEIVVIVENLNNFDNVDCTVAISYAALPYIFTKRYNSIMTVNLTNRKLKRRSRVITVLLMIMVFVSTIVLGYYGQDLWDVPYFAYIKSLSLITLLLIMIELLSDLFVTPNYKLGKNPHWTPDYVPTNKIHYWLFDLKLVFIALSLVGMYYDWDRFSSFITYFKLLSFIIFLFLLFFLLIVNSGFINAYLNSKSPRYLPLVYPEPLYILISFRYSRYFFWLGLLSSTITGYLIISLHIYNIQYIDNYYLSILTNIAIFWLTVNFIINLIRFIHKSYVLITLGPVYDLK